MWLQIWGFAVEQAGNGLDAVKKARTFQPHLVLMDLWMPVVDGLTLLAIGGACWRGVYKWSGVGLCDPGRPARHRSLR